MKEEKSSSFFQKQPGGPMKLINEFFKTRPQRTLLDSIDDYFRERLTVPSFHINTNETDHFYTVTAELPGIPKEDIQLKVLNNELIVSIKKSKSLANNTQRKLRGAKQAIPLPSYVLTNNMKASYKDGILNVRFRKRQGKSIEIE